MRFLKNRLEEARAASRVALHRTASCSHKPRISRSRLNGEQMSSWVYIAAFAPDKGESVATLIKDPPPGAPVPPILPPQDGYLFLDKAKFPASFAADVDAEKAAFMAESQAPWGVVALSGKITEPAWRLGRAGS